MLVIAMLVIPRGTTLELPLIGITTDQNYQLLELPIRLVGIPNWLETLI